MVLWPQLPVLLYLVSVPLTAHLVSAASPYNFSRIAQLLLFVFATVGLIFLLTPGSRIAGSKGAGALALAIFVFSLLTVLSAPNSLHALREVVLLLGLIGVGSIVAFSCFTSQALWLSATIFSAAVYIALVITIAVVARTNNWSLSLADLFVGYDNHRFYSHVQTVVLPLLAIATSTRIVSRGVRFIAWSALTLGFALLISSAGRATVLALLLSGTLAACLFGRMAVRWLKHMGLAALIGTLICAICFAMPKLMGGDLLVESTMSSESLKSDHARLYLWKIALIHIRESPWLGIGPMHYAHYPNFKAAHPHNVYLQIAAEWGVPMLIIVATISWKALRRFHCTIRSCADADQTTVGIGLFSACIAVAADGSVSANFVMPVSQVWIAFLFGWSICWVRIHYESSTHTRFTSTSHRGIAVFLLLCQLWLVVSVYPEARDTAKHEKSVRLNLSDNPRNNPRFWLHGWF